MAKAHSSRHICLTATINYQGQLLTSAQRYCSSSPLVNLVLFVSFRRATIQSAPAGPVRAATSAASAQAAAVGDGAEPQLSEQPQEREPGPSGRPPRRTANHTRVSAAAGQLGPGQQCAAGE